ncbi:HAD-like domain-containing protein [Protomyces lactucae-debilis]|uniref:HAD-like domain-containing protein n=1 Tax=Protomyces lactucae-debilis TaxID=2754530 RepID=A0A1Y2FM84_PROLT|nr:HAD-like domain-containing protein [Protomyces lactucae-debilis]ORY83885.1 HAD-like domain-containing protein [Protomyces lactucae-debilis]
MSSTAARLRPKLKAVIFDMDGTLTKPQTYMFKEMRDALKITKEQDILGSIEALPSEEQEAAHDKIRDIERNAMSKMEIQPGLHTLFKYLAETKVRKAICTRNFHEPTQYLLDHFLQDYKIWPVITRAFTPPKPSPEPLLHILEKWPDVEVEACMMVGDGADDIKAAQAYKMDTILVLNKDNEELKKLNPTHVVHDLSEIIQIIEERTQL